MSRAMQSGNAITPFGNSRARDVASRRKEWDSRLAICTLEHISNEV